MLLPSPQSRALPLCVLILLVAVMPAQAQRAQPPAELSRFEIGAYVSFKQTRDLAGDSTWTGPGLSVDVNANVREGLALATRVETYSDGTIAALAGAQIGTGFQYANGRDRVPGRFFAKVLAGAIRENARQTRPALHLVAGADTIVSGKHGIGLHWDAGWEIVPGHPRHPVRGRVAIGVIVGPHVRKTPRTTWRFPGTQ